MWETRGENVSVSGIPRPTWSEPTVSPDVVHIGALVSIGVMRRLGPDLG